MIFAGISGSSQADTAGVGGILIPAMKKAGYSDEVSTGVTVAASTIGVIIPPSIPMVVIGSVVSISVAGMFLGGIIPGILIGLAQMVTVVLMSRRFNFPPGKKYPFREFLVRGWQAFPALVIPIIVIGGIITGVFTATEAGDICVIYAVIIAFLTKQMNLKKLWNTFKEVGLMSSIPLLICGFGIALSWILAYENVPAQINNAILSITTNATAVLVLISIIVLIAGCFMDGIAIIMLVCPILMPLVESLKIDPIHFGVVVTIGCAIGLITPPVGLCLFVASSITGIAIEKIFRGCIPFLIAEMIIFYIVIFYPSLVTWLPSLFGT
jgi:tripartite ATP-independent transporter DctM subunit